MSNLLQFHPLQFERNGQHLIEDLHLKYKPRLMLTKKNTEIVEFVRKHLNIESELLLEF